MKQVIKRDGTLQEFDREKIIHAVLAAFKDVEKEVTLYAKEKAENIADFIESIIEEIDEPMGIEEVQDYVHSGLCNCKNKKVASAFAIYREDRARARMGQSELIREIGLKLSATDVQNSNANMDEASFGGRKGEAANELCKYYALNYIMSPLARERHVNNQIYTHDLDSYAVGMHNCLTIPFDQLLEKGFKTRQCDIRPASNANTALQLVAVIIQLQSLQQFGGVAASHIDWTMVPYIRKSFKKHLKDAIKYLGPADQALRNLVESDEEIKLDDSFLKSNYDKWYDYAYDMTRKEVHQGVEGLYHNLNTLQSRSGNQLPFSSLNYGTCILPEGRMMIEELLNCSIEGVGPLHTTPIFPCGIFKLKKGVNRKPGDPNYDLFKLALKSTSLRLYPNYANCDWSVNKGYNPDKPSEEVATMGCRTYNGYDINGLGFEKDGRGNIAPATIILPTLAMETKEQNPRFIKQQFLDNLSKRIDEAIKILTERYEYICSQKAASAKFMYENGTMFGYDGKNIESALKHGTLAVGQVGLAETLQILLDTDQTTDVGLQFAKQIEELFNKKCAEAKKKLKLNIGVYYTPAESLCYTAMKKFKQKYGEIPKVSDRDYFTNSIHVPVWYDITPFEKIDIESQLTGYSNAGCITYVELDSTINYNLEALEELVNYAMDKDIPYLGLNVPNDTCLDCGFTGEFNDKCPMCGSSHIQQLRRVTGYLTGSYKDAFNEGKKQEVEHRVQHVGAIEL